MDQKVREPCGQTRNIQSLVTSRPILTLLSLFSKYDLKRFRELPHVQAVGLQCLYNKGMAKKVKALLISVVRAM